MMTKALLTGFRLGLLAFLTATSLHAYEALQGPTELLYWDKTNTYSGYTWFGVRGTTYLIDMEGHVAHTWPVGTNPHLLTNGNVLDASNNDPSGFPGFVEVDWNGSNVWSYLETRTNYAPHHDFLRMFNPKLNAYTTLYIANKSVSSNQCIAAGCNPANGQNYNTAQMDALVEVDMSGNVVWEWWFYNHLIQDYDATKTNYVGTGMSISNYPGRLNANITGMPVQSDWLHCNGIDYNQALDQIAVNSVRGEFYIIDHGNTFIAGNLSNSIALAASAAGDFLYRFGDPARYNQGSPPSILTNWTESTTGNKQIGGAHHISWIPAGLSGAGHFLIFNNAQNLFEHTQDSYAFEIDPYLNALTNDTAAYVNPPDAGYNTWQPPVANTGLNPKAMSKQIVWSYQPKASHGMTSHIGGSVQRLPNGNTFICSDTEGHVIEVSPAGDAVWEYINPVASDGIVKLKYDNWPMYNSIFRAFRIGTNDPALTGHTLTSGSTITGRTPSYHSP